MCVHLAYVSNYSFAYSPKKGKIYSRTLFSPSIRWLESELTDPRRHSNSWGGAGQQGGVAAWADGDGIYAARCSSADKGMSRNRAHTFSFLIFFLFFSDPPYIHTFVCAIDQPSPPFSPDHHDLWRGKGKRMSKLPRPWECCASRYVGGSSRCGGLHSFKNFYTTKSRN